MSHGLGKPADPAATKKPVDAWWTVLVVDPFAVRALRLLLPVPWVTPNRLTLASTMLGLASGFCFLNGQLVLGGILFQLRFFFDCLDGKLARARGVFSARGAALDVTSDIVTVTWNYWALGVYVVRDGAAGTELPASVVALSVLWAWLVLYRKSMDVGAIPRETGTTNVRSTAGRYVRAMARRRLQPVPWAVEIEILSLSLVPLLQNSRAVVITLWLAAAFYSVAAAVNAARIWRMATSHESVV